MDNPRSSSPPGPRPQHRPPSPPSLNGTNAFENQAYLHDDPADANHNQSFTSNGHSKEAENGTLEAVNLEMINMTPKNGKSSKKDVELDLSSTNPYDEYFVPVNEHRKYMRGEKLYVTADKRGEKGGCKRPLCWTILGLIVFAVVVLIVLAATGVLFTNTPTPVKAYNNSVNAARAFSGFTGDSTISNEHQPYDIEDHNHEHHNHDQHHGHKHGEDLNPYHKEEKTDEQTAVQNDGQAYPKSSEEDADLNMYVPRTLEGMLTIDNEKFSPTAIDPDSEQFKEFADNFAGGLKNAIFENGINNYDNDLNVQVIQIKEGTNAVTYRIRWTPKTNLQSNDVLLTPETLKSKLIRYLKRNNQMINMYHISEDDIVTRRVLNLCQVNENDCKHQCEFNEQMLDFTCTCPKDQVLDGKKTCISVFDDHTESKVLAIDTQDTPGNKIKSEEEQLSKTEVHISTDTHNDSKEKHIESATMPTTEESESDLSFSHLFGPSDQLNHKNGTEPQAEPEPMTSSSNEPVSKSNSEVKPEPEPEPTAEPQPSTAGDDSRVSIPSAEPEPTPKPKSPSSLDTNANSTEKLAPEPTVEPTITSVPESTPKLAANPGIKTTNKLTAEPQELESKKKPETNQKTINLYEQDNKSNEFYNQENYFPPSVTTTKSSPMDKDIITTLFEDKNNDYETSFPDLISSITSSDRKKIEGLNDEKELEATTKAIQKGDQKEPVAVTDPFSDADARFLSSLGEEKTESPVINQYSQLLVNDKNFKHDENKPADNDEFFNLMNPLISDQQNIQKTTTSNFDMKTENQNNKPDLSISILGKNYYDENINPKPNSGSSEEITFDSISQINKLTNNQDNDSSNSTLYFQPETNIVSKQSTQTNQLEHHDTKVIEDNKLETNKQQVMPHNQYENNQKHNLTKSEPQVVEETTQYSITNNYQSSSLDSAKLYDILEPNIHNEPIQVTTTEKESTIDGTEITFDSLNILFNRSSKSIPSNKSEIPITQDSFDDSVHTTTISDWLIEPVTEVRFNAKPETKSETTEPSALKIDELLRRGVTKDDFEPDYLSNMGTTSNKMTEQDEPFYGMIHDYDSDDPRVKRVNKANMLASAESPLTGFARLIPDKINETETQNSEMINDNHSEVFKFQPAPKIWEESKPIKTTNTSSGSDQLEQKELLTENATLKTNLNVSIYEVPSSQDTVLSTSLKLNTTSQIVQDDYHDMNPFLPEIENNQRLVEKLQQGHDIETITNENDDQTSPTIIVPQQKSNNNNSNDDKLTSTTERIMTTENIATTENIVSTEREHNATNDNIYITTTENYSHKLTYEAKQNFDQYLNVIPTQGSKSSKSESFDGNSKTNYSIADTIKTLQDPDQDDLLTVLPTQSDVKKEIITNVMMKDIVTNIAEKTSDEPNVLSETSVIGLTKDVNQDITTSNDTIIDDSKANFEVIDSDVVPLTTISPIVLVSEQNFNTNAYTEVKIFTTTSSSDELDPSTEKSVIVSENPIVIPENPVLASENIDNTTETAKPTENITITTESLVSSSESQDSTTKMLGSSSENSLFISTTSLPLPNKTFTSVTSPAPEITSPEINLSAEMNVSKSSENTDSELSNDQSNKSSQKIEQIVPLNSSSKIEVILTSTELSYSSTESASTTYSLNSANNKDDAMLETSTHKEEIVNTTIPKSDNTQTKSQESDIIENSSEIISTSTESATEYSTKISQLDYRDDDQDNDLRVKPIESDKTQQKNNINSDAIQFKLNDISDETKKSDRRALEMDTEHVKV